MGARKDQILAALDDIGTRRAQAPAPDEIDEVIARAIRAGIQVTTIVAKTGIHRSQYYRIKNRIEGGEA